MLAGLLRGQRVANVDLGGQSVDLWIRPCEFEIERRAQFGIGAMVEHDVMRALMDLPAGMPVPLSCIDGATLLAIEDLIALRAVSIEGDAVVRAAIPAVELVGISKMVRKWSEVQKITWLGPHAPRYVLAPPVLARRTLEEIDTEVGVVSRQGSAEQIMRRAGMRRVFPSWQRWAIAEIAFAQWLRDVSETA